jgi:hypothetical protein
VRRFLRLQRVVVFLMVLGAGVALGIGFWPVTANVFGDASYSCGSGFLHSQHDWNVDSQRLRFQRSGDDTASQLPTTACPDEVGSRRDLALLILAAALAIGLIAQIVLERPRERTFGSTVFANRRRTVIRPTHPAARPKSEESSVK